MLMVFVNDIHSRPPCLISNLEETLLQYTVIHQTRQVEQGAHYSVVRDSW